MIFRLELFLLSLVGGEKSHSSLPQSHCVQSILPTPGGRERGIHVCAIIRAPSSTGKWTWEKTMIPNQSSETNT